MMSYFSSPKFVILIILSIRHVRLDELPDVVPHHCILQENADKLDTLHEFSDCVYNVSINLAAVNHTSPENTKHFAEMMGMAAGHILVLAHGEAEQSLAHQAHALKSERNATDFDVEDQVDRNHFMHIHFPDEGFDADGLINQYSESSREVKNLAKVSSQTYRTLELVLDAVGEADTETGTKDRTEYNFEGTTVISDTIKTSEISSHSKFIMNVQPSEDSPSTANSSDVEFHISSEVQNVVNSMGISNLQIQMTETLNNPFFDDTSALIRTPVVSVIMKDYTPGREHLPILLDGVVKPFEFWMPITATEELNDAGSWRVQRRQPLKNLTDEDIQHFHLVLPYNALVIVEIVDPKPDAEYAVVHLKDYIPVKTDFCGGSGVTILKQNQSDPGASLDTKFMTEKSNFSQSHLDVEQLLDYYVAVYMDDPRSTESKVEFTVKLTRLSCLFRDEDMEFWSERGCVIQNDSTVNSLHCSCNHASIFAGTQFAIPNDIQTVNVFDFKSSDFHDNPIILSTVCILGGLYIIGMILSFWLDYRDRKGNVGITIMTDLEGGGDIFYYLVTAVTGNRLQAGTSANVCIQLYGVQGRSQVYVLRETGSPVLKRGGIDSFLISSDKNLGKIEKIRIWHDNGGKSADWFCRKIIIKDIKADVEFLFFVERWLRVTGKLSTIIYEKHLATPADFKSFKRRFGYNVVEQMDSSHLWLTVIRHPTSSRFTRCQRLSCAFSILSLYLLSNIVMYGIETQDPDDPYGIQSYIVAFQMSLLELPFGFIIIYMFWLVRERYIPTLIVWRKQAETILNRPRGSVFVPRRSRNTIIPSDESPLDQLRKGGHGFHRTGSDISEAVSIKSTNVEEFEDWVAAYQGQDQGDHGHGGFVHSTMNQDDRAELESERVGWGRLGLAHALRTLNPGSFFFSGNNDVEDVENMMDQEIKEDIVRAHRKSLEQGEITQDDGNSNLEKVLHKVSLKEPQRHKSLPDTENVEIAFETCKMKPRRKGFFALPWWFIYIAWTVCLASIAIFLYFTLLYGLHYGYLRSLDWLLRISVSFLLSVFIIQPLNNVLFGLIFTILCPPKYWSIMDEERFQIITQEGEDTLGKRTPIMMKVFEPVKKHPPLSEDAIFELKIATRRWERVKSALGKLIFYLLLLTPLIIFSNLGRSSNDYMLVRNMRNMLQTNGPASMINSPEELYGYLRDVVTPMLHPTKKYNGKTVSASRFGVAELQDRINILIGVPRIRQVRAPKEKCHVPESVQKIFKNCYFHYSISNQETGTYYPYWAPVKNLAERKIPSSNDIWKFRGHLKPTPTNTSGLDPPFVRSRNFRGEKGTYDGGGYVAELGRVSRQTRSIIKYLQRTNWIDHQTRAIFVEMTAYNPNLHLFMDVVIMIERGPSHSFTTSFQITPLLLTTDDDVEGHSWEKVAFFLLLLGAGILFLNLIWVISFTSELRLHRQNWFWLDVVVVIGISVSLLVSLKKFYIMDEATEIIQRMKINDYASLQDLAFWDGIQTAAFSITQFICFLKIWQLLVFLEGGFLVTSLTVGLASNAIFAYFCIVFVVIMGFSCAGHIIFGSSMAQFRTLWNAVVTLVGQSLQVKIFTKLYTHDRIMGPIFGSLFGFIVAFLFLNILIAILNQSRTSAKLMAREKFRNWGLAESIVNHFCQKGKKRSKPPPKQPDIVIPISSDDEEPILELQPDRLELMKKSTIDFLRSALQSESTLKMREVKNYATQFLEGTGYRVIPKRTLAARQEIETEEKMNLMRLHVAEFLKSKIGGDMSVDDLHKYNDVNKTIVELRIFKLEKLVGELQRKLKAYHYQ